MANTSCSYCHGHWISKHLLFVVLISQCHINVIYHRKHKTISEHMVQKKSSSWWTSLYHFIWYDIYSFVSTYFILWAFIQRLDQRWANFMTGAARMASKMWHRVKSSGIPWLYITQWREHLPHCFKQRRKEIKNKSVCKVFHSSFSSALFKMATFVVIGDKPVRQRVSLKWPHSPTFPLSHIEKHPLSIFFFLRNVLRNTLFFKNEILHKIIFYDLKTL